ARQGDFLCADLRPLSPRAAGGFFMRRSSPPVAQDGFYRRQIGKGLGGASRRRIAFGESKPP
ncbi:hypothetical protein CMI37_34195, partial [Candidatus Pacearchaeota archaeon]|nr:hypothetical protein [Candidatus Pacearchaeota archaeon]